MNPGTGRRRAKRRASNHPGSRAPGGDRRCARPARHRRRPGSASRWRGRRLIEAVRAAPDVERWRGRRRAASDALHQPNQGARAPSARTSRTRRRQRRFHEQAEQQDRVGIDRHGSRWSRPPLRIGGSLAESDFRPPVIWVPIVRAPSRAARFSTGSASPTGRSRPIRRAARRSARDGARCRVSGLETDHELAAAEIEDRPLDHRGLRQHQRDRLLLGDAVLVLVGQFLERECRRG